MNIRAPASPASPGRRLKSIIVLGVLIILGIVAWRIYDHNHKKPEQAVNTGPVLSTSQIISAQTNTAQKSVDSKQFQEAVDSYLGASSNAFIAKNYKQAADLLQKCIATVPDQYVPWSLYDSLYVTAKQLNDKSLEKSSLQTAINKAEATNSGATASDISLMKQALQSLD